MGMGSVAVASRTRRDSEWGKSSIRKIRCMLLGCVIHPSMWTVREATSSRTALTATSSVEQLPMRNPVALQKAYMYM